MKREWKAVIAGFLTLCMVVPSGLSEIPAVQAKETGKVVVIDASDYGADPTGGSDSTVAIQDALAAAKRAREDGAASVTVSFPKGEYHIYKDFAEKREYHTSNTNSIQSPEKTIGILIEDQEDLTLDGNGSLFLMHGNMMALAVVRSGNVTLEDFSWDFAVPTVSEMTITDMGEEDGKPYTDFYIPDCCPYQIQGNTILWTSEKSPYTGNYYWTETGIHNAYSIVATHPDEEMTRAYFTYDSPFNGVSSIRSLGDTEREDGVTGSVIRITYSQTRPSMQKKGMILEFASSAYRETAGAFTWESEHVTARKVNVHFMHGFGWLIQMSRDVYYYECNLTPREGSGHVTVSYADGIHASGAAGDLVIENCNFSNTHDDPINLHGTFTRVENRMDDHTLQLKYIHTQQGGFPQYHVGDQVAFFTRDTLESTDGETLYTVSEVVSNPGEDGTDLRTMVIRFEETLPSDLSDKLGYEPKYVAENVTYAPKVTIRGCTFRDVPTRGILCTTRNPVLIENNTFLNMSMATIYLSNDSDEWYESGPIRDMTIRGNTFYIKSIGRTSWEYAPAVYIHPVTKGGGLPDEDNPIHKNITIEDNRFCMDVDTVVKAESVENLTIRNNTILRTNPDISIEISAVSDRILAGDKMTLKTVTDGDTHERDQDNVFEFTRCKNVVLEGNTYDDGLKRYAVLSGMSDGNLVNLDPDIQVAYDRSQPVTPPVNNVRYTSSDPDILSVEVNGRMTAKKAGTAVVSAYYIWNGETITSNQLEMTVVDSALPEDQVTIQGEDLVVLTKKDETHAFLAQVESGKSIHWSVEDFVTGGATDAAVIDEAGILTAKKNGVVWVKATCGVSNDRKAVILSLADTGERNPDFSVTREDPANYTLTGERIEIDLQSGDLYQETNNVKNLFLYQIPEQIDKDNLRTVIKMENLPVRENGQWDTASFLLYQNDDNYLTVGKKSHYNGIATVTETNGAAVETGGSTSEDDVTTAWLGFCKIGNMVSVDFKTEGGSWQHVRDLSADMLGEDYKIGFTGWESNDRGKKIVCSEFRAGSGDMTYEELCEQEAISFLAPENQAPQILDASFDREIYEVGEKALVTSTYSDADDDAQGRTLYSFTFENGQYEVTEEPELVLEYAGKVICQIYPVDEKGMPGLPATVEAVVREKEIPADVGPVAKPVPGKGSTFEAGGIRYKVTRSAAVNGTVSAVKPVGKKKSSLTIPASVACNGYSFKVTAIGAGAFAKNTNLKKLVIGSNLASIGSKAFYRCTKLTGITFKSTRVPKISSGAFRGIREKCRITVPKKMSAKSFAALKTRMKKAGAGKKVVYKKKG